VPVRGLRVVLEDLQRVHRFRARQPHLKAALKPRVKLFHSSRVIQRSQVAEERRDQRDVTCSKQMKVKFVSA
jgi:hypothetical protein